MSLDPDYARRKGYDPRFLGIGVPLPKLTDAVRAKAVALSGVNGDAAHDLKYHHFSVIMNRETRLAFVAAVNFDATATFRQTREGADRWFMDPRIDAALQAGKEFYSDNPLDRGHLVRRADAAWGGSPEEAAQANEDTFHFTNCSPQHEIFNQAAKARKEDLLLWGNIEAHIAAQIGTSGGRVSIFNGPVFRSNDRSHRGLRIPKEFWKVVVYRTAAGPLAALAFILSQEGLIADLPLEDFVVGPYRPFQVTIQKIEARTKLDFGELRSADPLGHRVFESLSTGASALPLTSLSDIVT
jgi:endonuclease G, mitochondrial